ncbi:MAG: hydrogenase expression/formation C-terminal domain-containing protein [Rhodobacter sp.]|nr:hydrogenase expression/formation C-terminal domain-containing protein [Rhodobacter sp.]
MSHDFQLPTGLIGPGSQATSTDGAELEFMAMPSDMRTYASHVPMLTADAAFAPAVAVMEKIAAVAARVAEDGGAEIFDLSGLDTDNRRLVAETMGEGEVAMKLRGVPALAVQESVFAGIWSVTAHGVDRIEVAPVPEAARDRASVPVVDRQPVKAGPGVVNAPALLAELEDKSARFEGELHVINLSLLPHTEEDLAWLAARLGQGATDILSRGYGNCRIRATATANVWRVQFYNSVDTLILDTFEVTDVPEVAVAAPEDLADSARRLSEVLEAIR